MDILAIAAASEATAAAAKGEVLHSISSHLRSIDECLARMNADDSSVTTSTAALFQQMSRIEAEVRARHTDEEERIVSYSPIVMTPPHRDLTLVEFLQKPFNRRSSIPRFKAAWGALLVAEPYNSVLNRARCFRVNCSSCREHWERCRGDDEASDPSNWTGCARLLDAMKTVYLAERARVMPPYMDPKFEGEIE